MSKKDYLEADLNAVRESIQRAGSGSEDKKDSPEPAVKTQFDDEFKRDLQELIRRYTENIASLEGKINKYNDFSEKCSGLVDRCRDNLEQLQSSCDSGVKDIALYENMRLEFFRENARLKSLLSADSSNDNSVTNSEALWLEFCSLKFLHLFRVGFIVCLPVIITIFAGCLLLALVIMLTMGALG